MDYLLEHWNLRISFWLTAATGIVLLWQYIGAKGRGGHVLRWASALALSIFVVYMNTESVLNQPRVAITNPWHMRFMGFHQDARPNLFCLDGRNAAIGHRAYGFASMAMERSGRAASHT